MMVPVLSARIACSTGGYTKIWGVKRGEAITMTVKGPGEETKAAEPQTRISANL